MADLTITPANVVPSAAATIYNVKAGATITAGQSLYEDASTSPSTYKLYDADSATAAVRTFAGIAGCSGSAGQIISLIVKDPALAIGATVAKGAAYVGSATAGGIAPAADATTGWYVTLLGVGISTSAINFNPTASGVAV